ncbi:MAG: recombinase family protein, partial [Abitibacteriaceae bacterium]|nr:recombinase family protein [Abditibacteriaceae bacterium]
MKQPSITFDKMASPGNTFGSPATQTARRKKMLLYARVSTEEQTKGNYPSCDSQIEELEAECLRRGWEVHRTIKDEGYTAATMRRPGLTEMRWLVQAREVDGILCTWYDRLTRSREFYILDHEFRTNNVELVTLHDATDTKTAAGRFMESVIVAAKTYDRDQTSEKVRIKMRMRLEKGLHQGGLVPFGFTMDAETKMLHPQPEQIKVVEQLFRVYVEQRSDFAVRNWLKAHQIPSPRGKTLWQVSTIHDLLCNRRYIGEIEINRDNKGVEDLPEMDQYRVAQAPHGALIPVELFELAQAVRNEKRADSPNRVGKPHSYSQTQTGRVYTLQGILTCGCCTHAMTPWYVRHKAGGQRRRESYVHYYVCAQQQRLWKQCDHKNMILARLPERWILERISDLVTTDNLVEQVISVARAKCESQLQPEVERLNLTRAALAENQTKIDQMLETISSG